MAPLNIVIIGAGIAGLTAAATLRHQGHSVTLLEKSTFNQETGAAILVGPNVTAILQHFGFDFDATGANLCLGNIRYGPDGEVQDKRDLEAFMRMQTIPWYMIHRNDLHAELKRLVLDPEGKGPMPELLLGCKLLNIDVEKGSVELENGRVFQGDVIIGADGNRSIARLEIKPDAQLVPWGKSCYRWLRPKETLMTDPDTKSFFGLTGYFGEFMDVDRRIIFYPCRHNTMINLVAFVDDEKKSDASSPDYNQVGNKQVLEKAFNHFPAGVRKAINLAEDDIKVWGLYDMEIMPEWTKGKLVLIGDAAHPCLPFMGQGGAIAIEDGASIGVLLPAGTTASEVPGRLKLYQAIRHERATRIQQASCIQGMDTDKRPADFDFRKEQAYGHNHNEWEYSSRRLEQSLQERGGGDGK